MTTELKLGIDARLAKQGAREYTAAIKTIKAAMADLERDTDGLFKKVSATAKTAAPKNVKAQFTAINSALRSAESSASTLHRQLNKIGNVAGLKKTDAALEAFRQETTQAALTTTELRAAQDRLAQAFHEVRQQARDATEIQRLRTQFQRATAALDATTTGTHAYRRAQLAIEQAHRSGAISTAQMNRALAAAKQEYISVGAAAANAAAQKARLFGTRAGWGQNMDARQIAMQLSQVGQQGAVTGNYLQALAVQLPDLALGFGPVGIAAGAVAGVLGTTLIGAMGATEKETDRLGDSLSTLESAVQALSLDAMAEKYGVVTDAVKGLTRAQAELALFNATDALKGAQEELTADSFFDTYADNAAGRMRKLQHELHLSVGAAGELYQGLERAMSAETPREAAEQYAAVRQLLLDAAGGTENMTAAQRSFYGAILRTEEAQRRVADLTGDVTGQTEAWASRMAGVRSEIDAIKVSLGGIGGGLVDNAAKAAELAGLKEGKGIREAASAAARARKEIEWGARSQGANWFERQLIGAEKYQFERGQALDAQLDAARAAAREAATSAGSGGRSKSLSDGITRTTQSLQEQALATAALTSKRYESREAARLWAEAMAEGKGTISEQTAALIENVDKLAVRNAEMAKSGNNFGEALAAGTENALETAIRNGLTGNEVSIADFGRAIQGEVASSVAKGMASKITDALGLDQLFDVGAVTSGQTIASAMISASATGASLYAQAIATGSVASAPASAGNLFSFFGFSEGGYSDRPGMTVHSAPLRAFLNAPHYAEGTANTTNGIPSILHPNEAVVPLSRGRKIPVELGGGGTGGGLTLNGGINVQVESNGEDDDGLAMKIGVHIRESLEGLIEEKMAEGMMYGGALNPRGARLQEL
ncbi:hypothetical protein [Cribrihabitans neustonicus]|uniref:hypothetical protein n=1 Tax=Cribrihabitans neustonicus TaxID=1429085 RepID=UPI003B5A72DA